MLDFDVCVYDVMCVDEVVYEEEEEREPVDGEGMDEEEDEDEEEGTIMIMDELIKMLSSLISLIYFTALFCERF